MTKVNYIILDNEGFITQSGTTDEVSLGYKVLGVNETLELVDDPINNPSDYYWKNGLQVLPPKPDRWSKFDVTSEAWIDEADPATLANLKTKAIFDLNNSVENARNKYVSNINGQDSVYARKKDEAIAYLAESPEPTDLTNYKFMQMEVGITASTAYELAQLWLNMDTLWTDLAATMEGIRMTASSGINSSTTSSQIETHLDTAKDLLINI